MAIEVNSSNVVCSRCGKAYGRRKGYFPVNYGSLYKGIGHISVCKECIDIMYNTYLSQTNDVKMAIQQMCRKLDLYWSEKVYERVDRTSTNHTMMTNYISKLNTVAYSGKSYDDTLAEEGLLWELNAGVGITKNKTPTEDDQYRNISADVIEFWGSGYEPEMYTELEQRKSYWISRFPPGTELDVGTEALLRQICSLELDINRDRAAGRPVDKSVNTLNNLLGSAMLKPAQKKTDDADASIDKTPLGVWAHKLEHSRPIKEVDPELRDVDGIVKYISIWYLGHLCKMLGIKNSYCKLYETEIAKLRIEHPEYEDEDDETLFNDIFCSDTMSDNTND